jgi:hypothetical protein
MAVNWEVVPERFRYLRHAVELCGETGILPFDPALKRHVSFTERATKEQLDCLASVHGEILRKNDVSDICMWCKSARHGTEEERGAAWKIGGILGALVQLADQGVSPFCDAPLVLVEDDANSAHQDSSDLPERFRYLIGPALYFGERYSDDVRASAFLEEASQHEKEWLATIAERVRVNNEWSEISQWLKQTVSKHLHFRKKRR